VAEDQDPSQKTEEPTQRRLDEARRKGQVPTSREVHSFMLLAAGALVIGPVAPGMAVDVVATLRPFIAHPHAILTDPAGLGRALWHAVAGVALALLLPLLLFVLAAIAAGLIQNGPMLVTEPLKPKLERVSPLKGLKRLFGLRGLVEFAKSLAKVALVGALAFWVLWPSWPELAGMAEIEAPFVLGHIRDLAFRLLLAVAALMALIALLDVAYQRFEHHKQQRMSKRDIKEEHKQSEGDPQIKARLRQLRLERARRRMMAEVPKATVVITNPTHYAVALRYEAETMAAPRLVAKGRDELARRIRETAEAHGVPVVGNPPLARALHDGVDLLSDIPPVHYRAVAEIIGYVMSLSGRSP
jgi:flagellar biosynthesis protein FlhB